MECQWYDQRESNCIWWELIHENLCLESRMLGKVHFPIKWLGRNCQLLLINLKLLVIEFLEYVLVQIIRFGMFFYHYVSAKLQHVSVHFMSAYFLADSWCENVSYTLLCSCRASFPRKILLLCCKYLNFVVVLLESNNDCNIRFFFCDCNGNCFFFSWA